MPHVYFYTWSLQQNSDMKQSPKHPMIEQLIQSQILFLEQFCKNHSSIQTEGEHLYQWLSQKQLQDFLTDEQIIRYIRECFLKNPIPHDLLMHFAKQMQSCATHTLNEESQIQEVIQVMAIDRLASFIAEQTHLRSSIIHFMVHHQSFSTIMSELLNHAIQNYFEETLASKTPSHVNRFMKMGKSMFENMTDATFEKTITQYIEKNIPKIRQLSEYVLVNHLTNERVYHLQAELWHQIKEKKLVELNEFLNSNDYPELISIINDFWNGLRETNYFNTVISDHIYQWYELHKTQKLEYFFNLLGLNHQAIQTEIIMIITPVVKKLINDGYLKSRLHPILEAFYAQDDVQACLKQIQ
ncbi:hypothetical protein [Acinetobacter pollinis]|nr:hypothetical protein [Acinetobacter pollinis]